MNAIWWIAACGLLLNIAVGLGFTASRRGTADSLLAVFLFGTAGVALVLVLAQGLDREGGEDIALALALLAVVLGVAASRLGWLRGSTGGEKR